MLTKQNETSSPIDIPFITDIWAEILSYVDRKTLIVFESICKKATLCTEKIWEELRKGNHFNFSWASMPTSHPKHHRWSYLLNEAIVTCLEDCTYIHKCSNPNDKRGFSSFIKNQKLNVYPTYIHLINQFPEFKYFYLVLYCDNRLKKLTTKQISSLEQTLKTIPDDLKEGGDLALHALTMELKNNKNDNEETVESQFSKLGMAYLSAIEKNATFLANRWFDKIEQMQELLDIISISEADLKQHNNSQSNVCENASDIHELLAIKAAEKQDYQPIIKLLSMQSAWFLLRLIKADLKLPSTVWLEAARKNNEMNEDIILLYAKAIESDELKTVPSDFFEEIQRKLIKEREPLPADELEWRMDLYKAYWEKDAPKLLRIAKDCILLKVCLRSSYDDSLSQEYEILIDGLVELFGVARSLFVEKENGNGFL